MIGGTTNGEPVGFTLADGKIARWPKTAARPPNPPLLALIWPQTRHFWPISAQFALTLDYRRL
jgi:hypothetical protein